jgi:hypothetical protein
VGYEGWRIVVDPDLAALKAAQRDREVKCSCTSSPFCAGPLSRDWLTCSTTCRACKPAPFKPPTRTPALAGDPNT